MQIHLHHALLETQVFQVGHVYIQRYTTISIRGGKINSLPKQKKRLLHTMIGNINMYVFLFDQRTIRPKTKIYF